MRDRHGSGFVIYVSMPEKLLLHDRLPSKLTDAFLLLKEMLISLTNKIFKFSPICNCMQISTSDNILSVLHFVPLIFPNVDIFTHLVVPAGWDFCLRKLTIL